MKSMDFFGRRRTKNNRGNDQQDASNPLKKIAASYAVPTYYACMFAIMGLALKGMARRHRTREKRGENRTDALLSNLETRKCIEEQLEEAQRLAQIGSWNWDLDSDEITWSDELYRIYGVRKENFTLTSAACAALIHEEDLAALSERIRESRLSGQPFRSEHRIRTPSGLIKTVMACGRAWKDESGRVRRMFGTVQDVTEAKLAESSLREAEARYRTLVEISPDAILVQQDNAFVFANRAACCLLQVDRAEELIGKSIFSVIHPDFHELVRERLRHLEDAQTPHTIEEKFVRMDGSVIDVEVNAAPFSHRGKFASLTVARDITERKKNAEQMTHLAYYDALTGLPNRVLFRQRLEHALTLAERPGQSVEVLFLDLDRFKDINDTQGHTVGDLVLQEAALRLQTILRGSDTVARMGGDEFVVLVENIDEPHRGGIIAEKILAAFKPPFMSDKKPQPLGVSIGIASFPSDGADACTLLKNADIAMYRAKESGRNTYRYYSPMTNRYAAERISLESALAQAMEHGELSLHYQPEVDLTTNRIGGMEALLRWQHPTLGPIAPETFIPIAEQSGLILPIGYWAIRTACLQNRLWQEAISIRLKVAVNISLRQLTDEDLAANLREILDDTQLEPDRLELEIAESAAMSDPGRTVQLLHVLSNIGIGVAIDGFGAGYSCLAHLKQFPVCTVKIDRSFVQGIPASHGDAAIAKTIISLAHNLGCSAIAEGAETREQCEFLKEQACDGVQGFYFSGPVCAEAFGMLLEKQESLSVR